MTAPKMCECGHRASVHYSDWGCEAVGPAGACECAEFTRIGFGSAPDLAGQKSAQAVPARAPRLVGSTLPRLWTPPLAPSAGWAEPEGEVCECGCGLSESTSRGFAASRFAAMLGVVLYPWQRWLLVHGLELREDGRYRFRTLLVLVSRQQGKTTILRVLTLWRMWEDGARLVLGTSTKLDVAKATWRDTIALADDYDTSNGWPIRLPRHGRPLDVNAPFEQGNGPRTAWPTLPGLESTGARAMPKAPAMARNVREGVSDMEFVLTNGARYKISTASRDGGRGLSVDLAVADELREHKTDEAWSALYSTTAARLNGQVWALSNQGDDSSVVLNDLRDRGLATITDPASDVAMFIGEWSAPDGCDLLDREAWAQANPSLGHNPSLEDFLLDASRQRPEKFRTENLCQRVANLDPAVDGGAWAAQADPHATLAGIPGARITMCLDVAAGGHHATLVAATVLADGRARIETVGEWASLHELREALPGIIERNKPRALGWYPQGPAAAMAVDLLEVKHTKVVDLGMGVTPTVCQGFAEEVRSRRLLHSADPMLTAQVLSAVKVAAQDGGWRFTRKGTGNVDAAYAAAGALHLARTAPASKGRPRILVVT